MIDKEAFLKASTPERDVGVSSGVVRVRGLTRREQLNVQVYADDLEALECHIIALSLVDPALTLEEVVEWYRVAPAGDTDLITKASADLSGIGPDAPKSGVPGIRSEQGS